MELTDAEPTFPHRKAGHCGSGALRDLLEFHQLDYGAGPLSEAMVFGLGGGLGFLYVEASEYSPPVYLVGRTGDMERDFAAHLRIDLDVRSSDDPAEGWEWVREQIDAGRPPMVWADIACLEYLRVRMSNTRHDIIVVGYDRDRQVAWVADNDREDLQPCSFGSLEAARNSDAFPGPNRNTTFVYDWPEALGDPRPAVRAAIERAAANMLGGGGALAGMSGATGLHGVEAFERAYAEWPRAFGDSLPHVLKTLLVFIVKAGTGGAMFRSLHAGFLHDAAALLDDPRLERMARLYDELAATWISLADCAAAGNHQGGLEPIGALTRLEREGALAMEGWLDQSSTAAAV
jgi:hypothetical protein